MNVKYVIKNLNISYSYFYKLYIIGPTADQCEDVDSVNDKADVEFIKALKK